MADKKHVVVLGAGFGGLTFCRTFQAADARITLVDRTNHHLFQPLLYQVAAAGLSAPDIAQPIRSVLSDRSDITVLMESVAGFDLAQKKVLLEKTTLNYDYLVLALGSKTGYFGHPEWEQFAPGLKTLNDALRIRSDVLLAFEKSRNRTGHHRARPAFDHRHRGRRADRRGTGRGFCRTRAHGFGRRFPAH
ncbi:MAG: FAD-dependent oxidoreductase [Limisphaerales bacterium]